MLVVVDGNVRARDDGLDDRLAVRALAGPVGLEGLLCLLEGESMGDEGLQVDLALCSQCNTKLVVARL